MDSNWIATIDGWANFSLVGQGCRCRKVVVVAAVAADASRFCCWGPEVFVGYWCPNILLVIDAPIFCWLLMPQDFVGYWCRKILLLLLMAQGFFVVDAPRFFVVEFGRVCVLRLFLSNRKKRREKSRRG